jgi:hypothetical protein
MVSFLPGQPIRTPEADASDGIQGTANEIKIGSSEKSAHGA